MESADAEEIATLLRHVISPPKTICDVDEKRPNLAGGYPHHGSGSGMLLDFIEKNAKELFLSKEEEDVEVYECFVKPNLEPILTLGGRLSETTEEYLMSDYDFFTKITYKNQWTPPCGKRHGCETRSCRRMCVVFSILLYVAEKLCKHHKFVSYIYIHIDSFINTLLSIEQQHLDVNEAFATTCDETIYAKAFEKTAPDVTSAYTVNDVPNITAWIPLLMSFNHEPAHNKKTTKIAYPRASESTVNRIISILNIVNKALPHRYVKRKFYRLLRFECFGVNEGSTTTKRKSTAASNEEDNEEGGEDEDDEEEEEEEEEEEVYVENIKFNEATCKAHEKTLDFFVKILVASLLGLYEWSFPKMVIDVRMLLYRFFNGSVSRSEIYNMMNMSNTMFLFYVVKDYIVHICKDESLELEIALSRICKFDTFVVSTKAVMQIGRSHIISVMEGGEREVRCLRDMFGSVDSVISSEHVPEKTHIQDQSCLLMYNTEKILGILKAHNYMLYSNDDSLKQEWNFESSATTSAEAVHPTIAKGALEAMRALIKCYPVFSFVPIDILVFFGLDPSRVHLFKNIVFERKTVLDRFLETKTYSMFEYALFYNFINECNEANLVNVQDGDVVMFYNQYMAFSNHYRVRDGEDIPAVLGAMLVCKTCRDIKDCSFFKPNDSAIQSRGNGKIAITGDGIPMCAYKKKTAAAASANNNNDEEYWTDSSSSSEFDESSSSSSDEDTENSFGYNANKISVDYMIKTKKSIHTTPNILKRKKAKSVDVSANIRKCHDSRLTTIDVIGKYVMFDSVTYICCYVCLRIIPLIYAFHIGDLVVCKSCRCHVVMLQEDTSGSIETSNFCGYCNKYIPPPNSSSNEKFYILIDDTLPHKKIMNVPFCNKIHGHLKWIENHCIVYKSLVIKGISEKWDTFDSNGVYIQVSY